MNFVKEIITLVLEIFIYFKFLKYIIIIIIIIYLGLIKLKL
jgi:hypothetical protein